MDGILIHTDYGPRYAIPNTHVVAWDGKLGRMVAGLAVALSLKPDAEERYSVVAYNLTKKEAISMRDSLNSEGARFV